VGRRHRLPGRRCALRPENAATEYFEFPYKNAKASASGFSPRGSDISSDGVFWAVLSSGHLASFDRRLCKANCRVPRSRIRRTLPEGFKIYQMPGPEFDVPKGTPGASAEAPYYVWVDQHNTLGLGEKRSHRDGQQFRLLSTPSSTASGSSCAFLIP
jgi:hypothetical protein